MTDAVSNPVEGVTVRFGDGTQEKVFTLNEQLDAATGHDKGDLPGEGWAGG